MTPEFVEQVIEQERPDAVLLGDLREQVWRNFYSRGDNGGEHDNNAIIAEILALRDERVQLLGYDNYAQSQGTALVIFRGKPV